MTSAVLFDFDNTLADTNPWKPTRSKLLRDRNYDFASPGWQSYFRDVAAADPIGSLEGDHISDIADQLIQSDYPVAIVTTSPRQAPLDWFKARYGYQPPVVVGFEDTKYHKPYRQPFRKALAALDVPMSPQVISVGDGWRDVLAAHHAGITSATFHARAGFGWAPDQWIASDLFDPTWLATHGEGSQRYVVTDGSWIVGGRYHTDRGHVHDLVWESKTGEWPAALVDAATFVVATAAERFSNPVLTTIPPHGVDDRFAVLRATVARRLGIASAPLLSWRRSVGSLHAQRLGPSARRAAVHKAMRCERIPAVEVIVLDDVLTSGATLREAARAIDAAGGRSVAAALTATLSKSESVDHDEDSIHGFKACPATVPHPPDDAARESEAAHIRENLATDEAATLTRLEREELERQERRSEELRRLRAEEAQRRQKGIHARQAERQQAAEAARRQRAQAAEEDLQRREERSRQRLAAEQRAAELHKKEKLAARNEKLKARADNAARAIAADREVEANVLALIKSLPALTTGDRVRKDIAYRLGRAYVVLNGVKVPNGAAAAGAVAWVRAGRTGDVDVFKNVHGRARFALLKLLKAAEV